MIVAACRGVVSACHRHRFTVAFAALAASAVLSGVLLGCQIKSNRHLTRHVARLQAASDRRDKTNARDLCIAVNDVRGVVEQLVLGASELPLAGIRTLTPAQRDRFRAYGTLLRESIPELAPLDCLNPKGASNAKRH